ncbi:MAG TPA: 30S ribosomal protein S2 [Flavobacteriales bacterium]|jgi:small subunit ribosomal protein S2|nr:30S ribosomal protein S2 [Flavobacteriales bacterium]
MQEINYETLLKGGVHFGHLSRKWNPKMAPYIFMKKNGIHIIDLNKTEAKLHEAGAAMRQMAKSGRKIMFVATKKQAKNIVAQHADSCNMPYITERWLGGMLTNFSTIRRSIRKMDQIEKLLADPNASGIAKRERLMMTRQKEKIERDLGSIKDLTRLPAALFIVDVNRENIAVAEAKKLGIPTFAMVDTNTDPTIVDFPIPSNDDASSSIDLIAGYLAGMIKEGLADRKVVKEELEEETKQKQEAKKPEEKKAE